MSEKKKKLDVRIPEYFLVVVATMLTSGGIIAVWLQNPTWTLSERLGYSVISAIPWAFIIFGWLVWRDNEGWYK